MNTSLESTGEGNLAVATPADRGHRQRVGIALVLAMFASVLAIAVAPMTTPPVAAAEDQVPVAGEYNVENPTKTGCIQSFCTLTASTNLIVDRGTVTYTFDGPDWARPVWQYLVGTTRIYYLGSDPGIPLPPGGWWRAIDWGSVTFGIDQADGCFDSGANRSTKSCTFDVFVQRNPDVCRIGYHLNNYWDDNSPTHRNDTRLYVGYPPNQNYQVYVPNPLVVSTSGTLKPVCAQTAPPEEDPQPELTDAEGDFGLDASRGAASGEVNFTTSDACSFVQNTYGISEGGYDEDGNRDGDWYCDDDLQFEWTFGDGQTSCCWYEATNIYTAPGTFPVRVEVIYRDPETNYWGYGGYAAAKIRVKPPRLDLSLKPTGGTLQSSVSGGIVRTMAVGDELAVEVSIRTTKGVGDIDNGAFDVAEVLEGIEGFTVLQAPTLPTLPATIPPSTEFFAGTWLLRADEPGTAEIHARFSGTDMSGEEAADEWTTSVEVGSGMALSLTGVRTIAAHVIEVVGTVTNSTGEDVESIDWVGGALHLDVLAGDAPLKPLTGPTPSLPAALERDESVEVRWRFELMEVGTVVVGLELEATTETGFPRVAKRELSIGITARDLSLADVQRSANMAIDDYFATAVETSRTLEQQVAAETRSASDVYYDEQYRAYRSMGFSEGAASTLASMEVGRESVSRYADAFTTSAKTRVASKVSEGWDDAAALFETVKDPVARAAIAESIVANTGYLGDAILTDADTFYETLDTTWSEWGNNTTQALRDAAVGQGELWRIDREQFVRDPLGFAETVGTRHGVQGADFALEVTAGVAEEVATAGVGTATRAVRRTVGEGVAALRGTRAVAETAIEEVSDVALIAVLDEGALDASGAATRRWAKAEAEATHFQDLAYGTELSIDDVERLGGFNAADAEAIQQLTADLKTQFGVDVEIVARTAEPASTKIANGVGKRSFTKEKAVGELDRLLGAPDELLGKVSVFEPHALDADVIRGLEAKSPGFRARYEARIKTQQKNWDAFQAGDTKMQKLAAASEFHGDITVISPLPGRPTYGIDYLEQLYEPKFLEANHMSVEQAQALFTELSTHPSRTPANIGITKSGNSYTFTDAITADGTPNPIVSDYDLQAVIPDGLLDRGQRSKLEAVVKERMDRLGRSGRHGWSFTANDLPAEQFDLAAEFIMTQAHPAEAEKIARSLAAKFTKLAAEFETKAARLPDTDPRKAKLQATAAKFRTYDSTKIEELWKPGEKTVVFTKGRITVGSGGGTTP